MSRLIYRRAVAFGLLLAFVGGCKPKPPAITTLDVAKTIHASDYTLSDVQKLEANSENAATEEERRTARMLLAETWLQAQSPFPLKETRVKLRDLFADAPDTWQAQVARLQIMRTFDVHTETNEMIQEAERALAEIKFELLNKPQDPFLISYLEVLDYGVKDMREIFIYFRGAAYATDMNIEKAREDHNRLSGELKKQLGFQIATIEKMTPEQRAKHRQILIDTVRHVEETEAKRNAVSGS
jgi:hypothetical protein